MNEERRRTVRKAWINHPKTSLVFCDSSFIRRVGMPARKVGYRYVIRQMDTIGVVIESFYDLYADCMGDGLRFSMLIRGIGGQHALADQRQVVCDTMKGKMMKLTPLGLRFTALRVPLQCVSILQEMADALCLSRRRTLIYLLSAAYYAVGGPLFEATFADVYRAVYTSSARPVRNAKTDLPVDSAIHRQPRGI